MMSFSSIRTSLSDQLVATAMVLCHPQEHSQVLRALGIYEEISFDPRTYMELVGPKMGLLQLLENLYLWASNQVCPWVSPSQVCAQLGTDPTRSDGRNYNPPLSCMVDRIGQIRRSTEGGQFGRSWRSENRPKSCILTAKLAEFG